MINANIIIPRAFKELLQPYRYKVFYGGRGGAKSWAYANAAIIKATETPKRILCARELQVSIADSVHKLLSECIVRANLSEFYDVQKTTILGINGSEFLFKGLKHNSTEIKSTEGIDIAWVEEAEKVSDESWELLIPTIRKEGSEIWISFNPNQPTDATYIRFVFEKRDDSVVRKVSWRDNPFFPSVLEKERLHMQKTDPEAYLHVWEGEFDTRYSGYVYAKYIAAMGDRIRPGLYDPTLPVHTAWDLGFDDATAIWFWQVAHTEIRLIDYYENSGEDICHYCEQLYGHELIIDEREQRTGKVLKWHKGEAIEEASHRHAYKYGKHYVPHDAANELLAAGGRSTVQQAHEYGVVMYVVPATSQQNGIEAARKLLKDTWADTAACKDGIKALRHYQFEYDEDKKTFKSKPCHDWSSHACDALEIIGQIWKNPVSIDDKPKPKFLHDLTAKDVFWPNTPSSRPRERI